jgi:hypothetical protein
LKTTTTTHSDSNIVKVFEFDGSLIYHTISELLNVENEPQELSPGHQARKELL